jgi:DNA-binding transcriptional MerR regulator
MTTSEANNEAKGYRIGAVARMTGISPDALRVWERRYQAVTPHRSPSGTRLYSEQDVSRLRLVKRLVDAGQAIGTVATLGREELQARVDRLEALDRPAVVGRPTRVLFAGPTLPVRLAAAAGTEDPAHLTVVGALDGLAELERSELQTDVLLVECPTLDEDALAHLRRVRRQSGAYRLLVVYGFAPLALVNAAEAEGATLLRFPVSWELIRHYCLAGERVEEARRLWQEEDMAAVVAAQPPARRFDDRQLARASVISTSIKCECPHHLAELILALARFERYSTECENRNAEDAALHAYLHNSTARARALMEGALAQLLDMEGLDVGDPAK